MASLEATETTPFPANVADAVTLATRTILASICGNEASCLSHEYHDESATGIVGIISFTGDLSWSFALMLPEQTACLMAQKFAGFPILFDSPDMGDVVGELANVIAGDITARLDRIGVRANMSLPTVLRGHAVDLLPVGNLATMRMDFASQEGNFWFKLAAGKPNRLAAKKMPGT